LSVVWGVQDNGAASPADVTTTFGGGAWFDFASSAEGVATVDDAGLITAVAAGTATITASLPGITVAGVIDLTVNAAPAEPTDAAPVPTFAAADVIALYSSNPAYTARAVDTFRTGWSAGNSEQTAFAIAGTSTSVLKYRLYNFAGIEFFGSQIDVTDMTHFSMTVWTPDVDSLLIKVVDFSGPGTDPPNTFVHELVSDQTIATKNAWVTIDIPLSSDPVFVGDFVSQIVLDGKVGGAGNTVFIDHMLFHR